jgi:cytochrome c oxidase assembly protein Cox11
MAHISEIELYHFLLYNNIFKVYFFTKLTTNYNNNISFECLQNMIYLYPNETSLVFFRLESNCDTNLVCLTIYIIYPLKLSFLITKIQCFCFSNVLLHSNELIELPILFYIDNFFSFSDYKIYIYYLLLIIN